MKNILLAIIALAAIAGGYMVAVQGKEPVVPATDTSMSFFVTSVNPGKGGDLGGLAGADAYCTALAEAAGVVGKEWRAYLSTTPTENAPAVNARDRIGAGPWYNAKGVMIAASLDALHGENNLTKDTALNERGEVVWGRGDETNMHDILTGSTAEGMASSTATTDTTCGNWTSATTGSAIVGHHDRVGINDSPPMKSWNSSHGSRGCDLPALTSTGGKGLFYCFAK
jgi:hypothetical protein